MHIVLYHHALIPPLKYGGTERVIYWLAKALISLGHRVTLIAQAGSIVPGASVIPYDPQSSPHWEDLIPADADIIHLWATPARAPQRPFLVTIEGNGQINERFHSNTLFVSKRHANNHGSDHFVYNGIDVSEYPCEENREPYLVFLAKASWKVKNLEGAMEIAKLANLPLKVMGSRNWPFPLNHLVSHPWKKVQYLGMLGDVEKRVILKNAKALLFPVLWHEPFGIAVTEALASGCPVYGTPYGSLPEIVTPAVGKLSTHPEHLAEAIVNQTISPRECRQRVNEGFNHIQMAQAYLDYYSQILNQGRFNLLSKNEIQWKEKLSAQTLLPWKGPESPDL